MYIKRVIVNPHLYIPLLTHSKSDLWGSEFVNLYSV